MRIPLKDKTDIVTAASGNLGGKPIKTILVLLMIVFSLTAQEALAQNQYVKTPSDYEGPFYPVTKQHDEDNDLIHVAGQSQPAQGDILNLKGVVLNTKGQPQKKITIEIWQTDPNGRYKHPQDTSPGKRDPNFQYWGKAETGEDGSFFFKTIIPGAYAPRPPHIHFKVWVDGKVRLTSQIYMNLKPSTPRSPKLDLQTIDLQTKQTGEFEGFFQIVI